MRGASASPDPRAPSPMRPLFGLILSVIVAGCAAAPRRAGYSDSVQSAAAADGPRAVVFVLDGVGDFRATSAALAGVVRADGLPLYVRTFEWSHGYGRMLSDHLDFAHARREGRRLAEQILCYRRPRGGGPPLPVYLLAHSGGSAAALAAAE